MYRTHIRECVYVCLYLCTFLDECRDLNMNVHTQDFAVAIIELRHVRSKCALALNGSRDQVEEANQNSFYSIT